MKVSTNTQAVLLLTAHFSTSNGNAARPLTTSEWGRFAFWLKDRDLTPEALVVNRPRDVLEGWSDSRITLDRLERLLNRGSALALGMEKWLRAGLWVMTRSDADYPSRLKKRLGTNSPPVLFGSGHRPLLDGGGLAVVGSRNVGADDLKYARQLGAAAADQGFSIVSGGARGVDETAMLSSLGGDGTAIGVLANSLLRACSSLKYRRHLLEKNVVLISPFHPEAGFNAGNAMQRNKYIYCLADAALVVHSGLRGGTWSGATENLKKRWVPLWINPAGGLVAANNSLAEQGGRWAPESVSEVSIMDLFPDRGSAASMNYSERIGPDTLIPSDKPSLDVDLTLYDLFLREVSRACAHSARSRDELAGLFDLHQTQLNIWLKRAVAEEKLRKLVKPVRYEWIDARQSSLFERGAAAQSPGTSESGRAHA